MLVLSGSSDCAMSCQCQRLVGGLVAWRRLLADILTASRDAVEVELGRDGSWQVTQTADPDSSDDDDDDDDNDGYPLLPPSEPAPASGTYLIATG